MTSPQPSRVYRHLALPVPVFDYLKNYQRSHKARHGEHLTIAQVVTAIVRDHQQNEESEAHELRKRPSLLRNAC